MKPGRAEKTEIWEVPGGRYRIVLHQERADSFLIWGERRADDDEPWEKEPNLCWDSARQVPWSESQREYALSRAEQLLWQVTSRAYFAAKERHADAVADLRAIEAFIREHGLKVGEHA